MRAIARILLLSLCLLIAIIGLMLIPNLYGEFGISGTFLLSLVLLLTPFLVCIRLYQMLKRPTHNDIESPEHQNGSGKAVANQASKTITVRFGEQNETWDITEYPQSFVSKYIERATSVAELLEPLFMKPHIYDVFHIEFLGDHNYWNKYGRVAETESGFITDQSYAAIEMSHEEYALNKYRVIYKITVHVLVHVEYDDPDKADFSFLLDDECKTTDIRRVKSTIKSVRQKYGEVEDFCESF